MIVCDDEKLVIEETLFYHDMPLLVTAHDVEGRRHLAICVEDEEKTTTYLSAVISDEIWQGLGAGQVDVREVYAKPLGELFVLTCYHPGREELEPYDGELPVSEDWLPGESFYLNE